MNIIYGAEMHNWVLECEDLESITITSGMTKVVFSSESSAEMAFERLKDYGMNHYSMCSNIILVQENI